MYLFSHKFWGGVWFFFILEVRRGIILQTFDLSDYVIYYSEILHNKIKLAENVLRIPTLSSLAFLRAFHRNSKKATTTPAMVPAISTTNIPPTFLMVRALVCFLEESIHSPSLFFSFHHVL